MANKLNTFTKSGVRLVSGSLTELVTTDHLNRPLTEDKYHYSYGIALRKDDPDTGRILSEIIQFCQTEWRNDQQKITALNTWTQTVKGLSMKIKDGDQPNSKSQYNENTKGCYVFYFSSKYPTDTCNPAFQQIEPSSIPLGSFVNMSMSISDNGLAWQADGKGAGIYMNPVKMMFIAEGDPISTGVSFEDAFGGTGAPATLPPGARPLGTNMANKPPVGGGMSMGNDPAMGMSGTGAPTPPVMGQPQQAVAPAAMGMSVAPPSTPSPTNITPHTGILSQGGTMPGMG
jgi:hypothetical protein